MGNSSSYGVDPATIRPKEEPIEAAGLATDDDLPFIYPKQHLSRIHQEEKLLNNTAVDDSVASVSSDVIEQAQLDFTMERRFLQKNKNVPIGRSSSPTRIKCFHCAHGHGKRCCLYIGDHLGDVKRYAKWKKHLERDSIRPGHFPRVPEAVSGGSTPNWFPTGTYRRGRDIWRRMGELNPPPPTVYLRRYALPLLSYGKEYTMLEKKVRKLTPYEEYQRELARQKKIAEVYRPVLIDLNPKTEQAAEALEDDEERNPLLNVHLKDALLM